MASQTKKEAVVIAPQATDETPKNNTPEQSITPPEESKKAEAKKATTPKARKKTETPKDTGSEQSTPPPEAEASDDFKKLAKAYAKSYPDCKVFHITSDKQVFLEQDLGLAQRHQRGLDKGELKTIKL